MGLIVTALTRVVWSSLILRKKNRDTKHGALTATWQTDLVMAGYAVFVVGWRQFSGIPTSDSAVLPILGSINSHFSSGAGALSFALDVAPVMGCISGILCFLRFRSIAS
jgi:hypothetical protein